jgi:hypothetical protein
MAEFMTAAEAAAPKPKVRGGTFWLYRTRLLRQWAWKYEAPTGYITYRSSESYWNLKDCIDSIPLPEEVEAATIKTLS